MRGARLLTCTALATVAGGGATWLAASAAASKALVVYSVATQEQFLNHEDDRDRGKGNNPFGNFRDSSSATKESGLGPFVGGTDRYRGFTGDMKASPAVKHTHRLVFTHA